MSALTFATAQLLRVLPRARVGRALGRLADHAWHPQLGRAVVGLYSRAYNVEMDECAQMDGFTSFDAFFTRGLRVGARPIDADPRTIVCPADGQVDSMGPIDNAQTYHIKGRPYRVEELVGDASEARRYVGGGGCVVYLSPRDYHRVHSPVDGHIAEVRSLPGEYYPVNSIGVEHVPNLFAINRRVAIVIDTPKETGLGRVTVVMVAAIVVGRITVSGIEARDVPLGVRTFDPPRPVRRGEEVGVFHLGSTAVVFLEKRAIERWVAPAGAVRFGQALARAPEAPSLHTNGAGASGQSR